LESEVSDFDINVEISDSHLTLPLLGIQSAYLGQRGVSSLLEKRLCLQAAGLSDAVENARLIPTD
jgi:hypothetical protein